MIKLFDILCIFYHALSDASLVTAYMIIWIFEGKLAAYQKVPSILFTCQIYVITKGYKYTPK